MKSRFLCVGVRDKRETYNTQNELKWVVNSITPHNGSLRACNGGALLSKIIWDGVNTGGIWGQENCHQNGIRSCRVHTTSLQCKLAHKARLDY